MLLSVGQKAAAVTVDGGLWAKLHQQLYTRSGFEGDLLVSLGPLHVVKAYLGGLGDFVRDTGWEQAVISARVVGGEASTQTALSGAAIYRALQLHGAFAQAMWDNIISCFLRFAPASDVIERLRHATAVSMSGSSLEIESGLGDAVTALCAWAAEKAAQSGTFALWWLYLQHHQRLENYLQAVRAIHTGGLNRYANALEGLLPLFVSMNKTNYRRMIPLQRQLNHQVVTKFPSLEKSLNLGIGLAASRTGKPGSLVGLDMFMEWATKDCKGPCRLASFLQPDARQRFLYTLSATLRLSVEMQSRRAATPKWRAAWLYGAAQATP